MAPSTLAITPGLRRKLGEWLQEDLGRGDLSAPALRGQAGVAHWLAKANGVFCGGVLLKPLLSELVGPAGHQVELQLLVCDGAPIAAGDRLLGLSGPAGGLVAGWRQDRTARDDSSEPRPRAVCFAVSRVHAISPSISARDPSHKWRGTHRPLSSARVQR